MNIPLNNDWFIACDPENRGRQEGWFAAFQQAAQPAQAPGIIQQVFPGYHGVAWYWTRFSLAALPAADERALLRFGAVDYFAEAWLNGLPLGGYEGGETPFDLECTAALRSGENLLAVRVINPGNEAIDGFVLAEIPHRNKVVPPRCGSSLNCGGIIYPVELAVVPDLRVADVFARPDPASGRIELSITVCNDRPTAAEGRLSVLAAPASGGAILSSASATATCPPGQSVHELALVVPAPRLWSLDAPYLYRVAVSLNGAEIAVRCGFRDFRVQDGHFYLNNQRLFLKSTHTGNHTPIGQQVAVIPDHLRRDIIFAKASGFNCVRFIAGVAWPEQLDFCDEIGILVYEECYAGWVLGESPHMAERFDRSTSDMIRRDRNHPSVAIWGLLNETFDGPVFRQAVDFLPKLRALDPTRLVLLGSGRWDCQPSIGSVSNPGSVQWEHTWGAEAPDAPPTSREWNRQAGGYFENAGDAHAYPSVPQSEAINQFIRTLGANTRPVFLSEYGIGSLMDVIREARRFEQAGARPDLEDAAILRAQAEAFSADWRRLGFEEVYPFPEDLLAESQRLHARQRTLGFDCIRSNPHLVGYNLTGMLDHGITGEGLWTFWREWKPGVFDAVRDGWSPLRWCLFADPLHGYSGRTFNIEAVLANEGVLPPGAYPAAFRILGPAGPVWEAKTTVQVDGAFASPALHAAVTLDGPAGEYVFAASLEAGGAPTGGRLHFHLSRADELPRLHSRAAIWGIAPKAEAWLAQHGVACHPLDWESGAQELILVGQPAADAEANASALAGLWARLIERLQQGSTAIFLEAKLFQSTEDNPFRLPLENPGRLITFPDWLYHKECVARRHAVFAGLPHPGILDMDYYGALIPHDLYEGLPTPDETMAAAFATGHNYYAGGYGGGLLLAAYRCAAGRFVINTFPMLDHLGAHPAADRLLLNLVQFEASRHPEPVEG